MNVNDVYELMLFILNKNQNGYLTPSEFNLVINQAQYSYISFLLGSSQTYMPGRPISKVELGQNAVVRDRLTPAIYNYILTVDSNGFSPYPGDFLQVDAMWSLYGYRRVKFVDQDRWFAFYNSSIDPVLTNPIYQLKDISGFQFAPESIGQARMSYVRNPPEIIWAYMEDSNGREVYNPAASANPIWDNISILEVIVRALRMVGVNLQAADVSQYAAEIKNTGQ